MLWIVAKYKVRLIMKKDKTKNKKTIIIIIVAIMIIITTLIVINIIQYFESKDDITYSSINEIIEKKYDGAIYIQEGNYYYIIYKGENANVEQLVLSLDEENFIIFNQWHEITKDSRKNFELINDYYFMGALNEVKHNDKYILLIERWLIKYPARVYDNFGDWEMTTIYGTEYYFKVLDSSEINIDYRIYAETEDGELNLFGMNELVLE